MGLARRPRDGSAAQDWPGESRPAETVMRAARCPHGAPLNYEETAMSFRRCCVGRCGGDGISYMVLGIEAFWLMMTNFLGLACMSKRPPSTSKPADTNWI